MNCKQCEKKIPKARLKAMPETEYCIGCVDEHGPRFEAVPFFSEECQQVALVKGDANIEVAKQAAKLESYEVSGRSLK